MKKLLSLFLVLALAFSLCVGVLADETTAATPDDASQSADTSAEAAVSAAPEYHANAKAALLIDLNTGRSIFEQDADEQVYPASLTKIMTLLLAVEAVERGDVQLDDTVTAYADCNADMVEGASNADIKVGETMTFEDFLYCAMISSANEACNIMAEAVSGDVASFVELMNRRAAELGMEDTCFVNCTGLPAAGHLTSAHDIAVMSLSLIHI